MSCEKGTKEKWDGDISETKEDKIQGEETNFPYDWGKNIEPHAFKKKTDDQKKNKTLEIKGHMISRRDFIRKQILIKKTV